MRSDNMPRPFAPEHGEEAESQLQRDIALVDDALGWLLPEQAEAWQRVRARLTPDRDRVKAHLRGRYEVIWPHLRDEAWADIADTAIAAMEGK